MVTPEDILKEHSKTVQRITEQLRHIVLSTIPEPTEKAYPAGAGLGSGIRRVGMPVEFPGARQRKTIV